MNSRHALTPQILDAISAGVLVFAPDGSMLSANAAAVRTFGLLHDESAARWTVGPRYVVVREDGSECNKDDWPLTIALRSREAPPPTTLGLRSRSTGEVIWAVFSAEPVLDEVGAVSCVVCTFIDVTAQKRIDAAYQRSQAQLRSVLESAPDIVIMTDLEARIVYMNRAAQPLTVEAAIGKSLFAYVDEQNAESIRHAIAHVKETGKPITYETTLEGELTGRIFSASMGPMYENGELAGFTVVTREITEFRALQLQLSVADRMASIGQLAAGIAHEVNNPLTYVMSNVERVRRELTAESPAVDVMAAAIEASTEGLTRIRAVARELRTLSRAQVEERALVDVGPVLDSSLRIAQVELIGPVRIVKAYGDAPTVFANEARIGQVFLNLLINATHAMSERGSVHNELRVSTGSNDEGHCVVEISDSGRGIPPQLLPRIFDPFVTSKPVGTGFGLSICKDIVTSLGGTIGVSSVEGVGTTFRVTLPPASVSRANAAREPQRAV